VKSFAGSISNTAFTANAGTNLNTSALALDATVTNRLPAGSTPANGESNAITTSRLGSYMFVFNGATWDRFTGAISGTVTANQGTANTAANAWPTKITDGTNTTAVKAASTAAAAADPSAVVALSPNSPVPAGSNIIGKVTTDQTTHGTTDLVADDITKVGGSALTAKTVPTGGTGQTAIPVYSNAVQLATYTIVVDSVATGALTANTRKDVLSIEHAVSATKTVKIRRIQVGGFQTTALVGTVYCKIFRGTAATSAGTTQTATPANPGTGAAELVAKTLPTITAATLVYTNSVGFISAATAQTGFPMIPVYDWQEEGETQPLQLRAANLDTLVIAIYSNVAHNLTLQISVIATEE
jgi:hypothetical protein